MRAKEYLNFDNEDWKSEVIDNVMIALKQRGVIVKMSMISLGRFWLRLAKRHLSELVLTFSYVQDTLKHRQWKNAILTKLQWITIFSRMKLIRYYQKMLKLETGNSSIIWKMIKWISSNIEHPTVHNVYVLWNTIDKWMFSVRCSIQQ